MKLVLEDTPLSRPDLQQAFASAAPFPLLVLDNFLPKALAEGLLSEAQSDGHFEKSNDYIFAKNKFESPHIERLGPVGHAVQAFLLSEPVAAALSSMYGRPLFVDPDFVGGGLHRGGENSFLDMHVDFNLHPRQRRWIRELNILLYLNKDWQPAYGGSLQLRNELTGQTRAVEPLFNRMVVMLTKDFTYHGYKRISFPTGTFRTSIATYAYSLAASDEEVANMRTTTTWKPEDGGTIKSMVAKVTPQLVSLKQKLLGSGTARKK